MNLKEVREKYGISKQTALNWVTKKEFKARKEGRIWIVDEEDADNFVRLYYSDRFTSRVGYCRSVFDVIDTPEKAYWLGFILADGCIQKTDTLAINLGGVDREHLEKFELFIEAQQPMIKTRRHSVTGNDLVCIQLSSKHLIESLQRHGIQRVKSGEERWIDTPFPRDFVRGVIDGDGIVRKDLTEIGLVGSKELLASVQGYFEKTLNVLPKSIMEHGTIYRISYRAKSDIRAIVGHLYQLEDVSLQRKYELIKPLLN